jgi:hypothetical protein
VSPPPITWHLDTTVWQRAVHGRHEAGIWWTGPGRKLAWSVYPLGGPERVLHPVAQGTGTDETDAKTQAETALRRLDA